MPPKTVDCGYKPLLKSQSSPVREVDCGFNPKPREAAQAAGPDRGTTEGVGPDRGASKQPRKL
jgi:hypothetical protein